MCNGRSFDESSLQICKVYVGQAGLNVNNCPASLLVVYSMWRGEIHEN